MEFRICHVHYLFSSFCLENSERVREIQVDKPYSLNAELYITGFNYFHNLLSRSWGLNLLIRVPQPNLQNCCKSEYIYLFVCKKISALEILSPLRMCRLRSIQKKKKKCKLHKCWRWIKSSEGQKRREAAYVILWKKLFLDKNGRLGSHTKLDPISSNQ